MKKFAILVTIMAVAGVASAEKMWAICDTYTPAPIAELFSYDTSDGTFINAPIMMNAITGDSRVKETYGMAVKQDTAYVSYNDVDGNGYMLTIDLSSMTVTNDVAMGASLRGLTMSLDGSTLYGGRCADDMVVTVNPTTGAQTAVADAGSGSYTDYAYWSALPGFSPATGKFWTVTNSYRQHAFAAAPSGTPTYVNRFFDDQPGSLAFDSAGNQWYNHVVSYSVSWGDPETMTGLGDAAGSYDIASLNSYSFAGAGFYAMSPVFVPEPATMSLLVLGGLGLIARKRR